MSELSFGNKKLGFGLMRLPLLDENDGASIDIELTKKMVDAFIENGFTYFDTAWMYCGFASENATKEVLVKRYPRDSYTLATKLHAGFIKTKEDRDAVFNKQLEKTGVEFFDYYLLHDIGQDHYKIYNAPFNFLSLASVISINAYVFMCQITSPCCCCAITHFYVCNGCYFIF